MNQSVFKNAIALSEALVALFGKSVEVVIHDTGVDEICYLVNPISKRQIGDPANLDQYDFSNGETVIGPYEKVNWDGSIIRSISVVLRDESEQVKYVLCVNFDLSDLQAAQRALAILAPREIASGQPEVLFKNDWHEKLNVWITEWCTGKGLSITSLGRASRVELIRELEKAGALKGRNATAYVARVLNVSRATIYNDLKLEHSAEVLVSQPTKKRGK